MDIVILWGENVDLDFVKEYKIEPHFEKSGL